MVQPSVGSVNRLVKMVPRLANPGSSDYSHAAAQPGAALVFAGRWDKGAGMKETVILIAICLGLATVGVATVAFAAEEPSGFRNVRFGATEEQIKLALPGVECQTKRAQRSCHLNTNIGDVPATVIFALAPKNGRFRQAVIVFKSQDYEVLRDAFIAKFGQPTGRVIAANEQCRWSLPGSNVSIQKHSSPYNAGIAALSTREYVDAGPNQKEDSKRQEERRERAKRGL